MDMCHHTTHADHAINGPCEDPENHPERFEYVKNLEEYWERR